MTSGYMWVRIRSAPYVMYSQHSIQYFAAGLQSQLGMETQIVGILNGLSAISVIGLSTRVPSLKNPVLRRVLTILCSAIIAASFSAEVALFRRKMPSYPFKLFIP